MSEKVCVYLRRSVFGRGEKESEVRVTLELDPQVTGAEASSQSDRFPHTLRSAHLVLTHSSSWLQRSGITVQPVAKRSNLVHAGPFFYLIWN